MTLRSTNSISTSDTSTVAEGRRDIPNQQRRRGGFRPVNTLASPRKPTFEKGLDISDLYASNSSEESMVRERSPSRASSAQYPSPSKREPIRQPLANISAKIQSPSPKHRQTIMADDENPRKSAGSDVEFGKASPLRNPLHGSKKSSVFIPKHRTSGPKPTTSMTNPRNVSYGDDDYPFQNKQFYMPGQKPASSSQPASQPAPSFSQPYKQPAPVPIYAPTNPPLRTTYPPQQIFTASNTSGFYLPGHRPAPRPVVDLTKGNDSDDEERFDPDAAIRADAGKFGSQDPYMYVDPNEANKNIKSLLEAAFDDEDQKGNIRLRSRVKKLAKLEKDNSNLADKLAALAVKDEKEDKDNEEAEEEEEDGTVDGLTVKLLPHQVAGVSWMIDKEISKKKVKGVLPHGGILADDMGLGKTVQSVALILTNPRPAPDAKPEHQNQKLPGKEVSKCTLVVAPLALIKQWEAEIKSKVTKSHAFKVLVHHGSNRTKSSDQLKKYDVVITTYQTLTSEHAGSNMGVQGGTRIGCMGVHWYRLILDEAHTIKNRNAKSTQACYALNSWYRWCLTGTPMQNNLDELQSLIKFLRIKPYCELPSWKDQIITPMKNGRGSLAMRRLQYFLKAFMKRRTKDILKEEGALNFGGKAGKDGENKGGMQIVKREVLTVACDLDPTEKNFYERLQARADKRLQDMMDHNGKGDYMGALVLLLRLRQACDHPRLVEKAMGRDKDALTTGVPSSQASRSGGDEMDALTALMGGVSVQNKTCDVCQARLSSAEARDGAVRCGECEADLVAVKQSAKEAKKEKKEKKAKAKADKRRARNRKVVDDSDEEDEASEHDAEPSDAARSEDEDEEGGGESLATIDSERSVDDDSEVVDSPSRARRRTKSRKSEVKDDETDEEEEDDEDDSEASDEGEASDESEEEDSENSDDDSSESDESDSEADLLTGIAPSGKSSEAPSTKIRQLLRILHKESPEHKTIVFSQFTTMLDLIEPHLEHAGLRYVRYDGSMRPDAREESLNSLKTSPKTRVLLCSLKCGSLGLNLTAASRVIIVEPFWNPFVEEQAIDRVHRLNQTIDVKVFRLTIRNSVEERILELQERKRELAKAAIEGGKGVGKLSMQDILGLFKRDAEHAEGDAKEDAELWQKFGGDNRLLDGPGFVEASEHVQDLGYVARPKPRRVQEHEVYGRRW